VALCSTAAKNGFVFIAKHTSGIILNELGNISFSFQTSDTFIKGTERKYEVLNVLPFTSERARMSIIVRNPEGSIVLYSKGADSVMLKRLSKHTPNSLVKQTQKYLLDFAQRGELI
jgi:phospholipid-translocating ATPase